jgi:putative toxin-antitoxin system antitoxin component (TIGR02293 family)
MTLDLIVMIMGGATTLGREVRSPIDFMEVSQLGMRVEVLKSIQTRMGFTNKEMSQFLDISESTLQRYYRSGETIRRDEAEKAYQISKVIAKGMEVFEDDGDLMEWLHTPNTALGEVKPIDWMGSSIGREQLLDLLTSIEYGMFS